VTCREWGQGVDDRISIVFHYFFSAKSTALIAAAPATLKHSLLLIVRRQPHVSRTNRFGTVVFGPDTLNCEVASMEQISGRQNLLGGVGRANAVDLAYLPEFLLCARTRFRLGGGCCPCGVKADVVLGLYSDTTSTAFVRTSRPESSLLHSATRPASS
jgi:hypothetical protein